MNPELPPALYGYLLGATLSGGLVLYLVYRLLRKAPLLERVKAWPAPRKRPRSSSSPLRSSSS